MYILATKFCLSEISANEWLVFKREVYELDVKKSFPIIAVHGSSNQQMKTDDKVMRPKRFRMTMAVSEEESGANNEGRGGYSDNRGGNMMISIE
jgi:hypothetical protein